MTKRFIFIIALLCAFVQGAWAQTSIHYLDREWDESSKTVTEFEKTINNYTVLTSSTTTLANNTWYVVNSSVTCGTLTVSGTAYLILCDGKTLTCDHIMLQTNKLHIFGQNLDSGKISISEEKASKDDYAAIQCDEGSELYIHGGDIIAYGGTYAAGIGSGYVGNNNPNFYVYIYGGKVEAHSRNGAGIGGAATCDGGNVTVYGGFVVARSIKGAGIGGGLDEAIDGSYGSGGTFTIWGGEVHATTEGFSAGIGAGGYYHNVGGAERDGGTITINGGTVYATASGDYGAGIGGGWRVKGGDVTINGGTVYAQGASRGAGIGSGETEAGQIRNGGTLTVNGGYVEARGGNYGAGIGGGQNGSGATVVITGGTVLAYGGTDAAGIGSGEETNSNHSINGGSLEVYDGYVYADGTDLGSGIGGGQDAEGANVGIYGGTVEAWSGSSSGAAAIGSHLSGTAPQGSLSFSDNMMVHARTNGEALQSFSADLRKNACWYHNYAIIEPCDHEGATCTGDGNYVSISGCTHCKATSMPFTFITDGDFEIASNWFRNLAPHTGNNVIVRANAKITTGITVDVGNIDMQHGGSITIQEGGQLKASNSVQATVEKNIEPWASLTGGEWYFIASPISTAINPNSIPDMITTTGTFDLYRYNQSAVLEWENYHQHKEGFNIVHKQGYLYASEEIKTLVFSGYVEAYDPDYNTVTLFQNGWNLIGNPFPCAVSVDHAFAELNNSTVLTNKEAGSVIMPCAGIAVYGNAGDEVTFTYSPTVSAAPDNNLQIAIAQTNNERGASQIDNAIISFNEGSTLPKFRFGENAKLWIPQDSEDYAITVSEKQGEMPLYFNATEDGTYTITVNPKGVEMAYLHLIDNMTGRDVDLLVNPSYSFEAKTTDYESRFKLVFAADDAGDGACEPSFAFISNGNIIVNGEGMLQMVDITGRVIVCRDALNASLPTAGMAPGVYVLRLINNNDMKTQKIVVR